MRNISKNKEKVGSGLLTLSMPSFGIDNINNPKGEDSSFESYKHGYRKVY
jgi:hypothetical protein